MERPCRKCQQVGDAWTLAYVLRYAGGVPARTRSGLVTSSSRRCTKAQLSYAAAFDVPPDSRPLVV